MEGTFLPRAQQPQLPARPTEEQHQRRFGDSDDSHLPPPCGDTSLRFRGQGAGRGPRLCVTLTSPRLLPDQLPLGGQMAQGDTAVRGPCGAAGLGVGGIEAGFEGRGQRAERGWL